MVDRTSITGVRHRYWLAAKYLVEMTFTALTTEQFSQLSIIFYNQGNGVTYTNPNTGLNFFGYPTVAEDQYLQGASYLKNLTIKLEQQ